MSHTTNRQTDPSLDSGPIAPNGQVRDEWDQAKLRRRMLEGCWRNDLNAVLDDEFDLNRRKGLGVTSTTKNLAKSTISQLAVIYDREPIVGHADDEEGSSTVRGVLDDAGLWQLAQSFSQKVIGMREAAYRVDIHQDEGQEPFLQVTIIPRDLFHVEADANTPDVPHTVYHYRLRQRDPDANGNVPDAEWTRDCISIRDPANPVYTIQAATADGEKPKDLSGVSFGGAVLGDKSGDNYPAQWRWADGTPFIPFALYHAIRTGKLTDSFTGIELFDGSLAVSALLQLWKHLIRDASAPQRGTMDANYVGNKTIGPDGGANASVDFGAILNFQSTSPGRAGREFQWDPGGDPKAMLDSIQSYAADIVVDFDVFPADIARTHTDARSGHAIEISRDGQRSAQRRYEPSFRRGDVEVCAKAAAMWNRQTDSTIPETGWTVVYPGLPLSMQEMKLKLEDYKLRRELGATSLPVLVAMLEGITEDEARKRLEQFQQDNARFAGPAAPPRFG